MTHEIVLGDFLRERRNALCHEAVGLPSYGQRRVTGLRREELALLAGISTSYYTRIEQGSATGVSAGVLDAIGRALQLDGDERAHLYRLARLLPPVSGGPTLHPRIELLLRTFDWIPAGALGPTMEVLGWNRACHQVFAEHLPFDAPWTEPRPNWARLLFTDERVRERFSDWPSVAADLVGRLRTSQSRDPSDPLLHELVADLCERSQEFADLWAQHPTRDAPLGTVRLRHKTLGDLELSDALLRPTDGEDQLVLVFLPQTRQPDRGGAATSSSGTTRLLIETLAAAPPEGGVRRPGVSRPATREPSAEVLQEAHDGGGAMSDVVAETPKRQRPRRAGRTSSLTYDLAT